MRNKINKFRILLVAGGVVILGLVVWLIVILLPDKGLVGEWVSSDDTWSYEFREDGTGRFGMVGVEDGMGFYYTEEGDILKFRYEGTDTDVELEYKIEGRKLTFGDVVYNRK